LAGANLLPVSPQGAARRLTRAFVNGAPLVHAWRVAAIPRKPMIDSLDTPNLTLCLLDPTGAPLAADDALDRAAALRHELRETGAVLSVAPTARPPVLTAAADRQPAVDLGAVSLAVLPPMLPPLLRVLRGWLQRNPGVRMTLRLAGEAATAAHDPTALRAADEPALIRALQEHLDACWGEVSSPAA
jgi:hypothetical protein